MTHRTPAADLRAIADELMEARRYVRTHPHETRDCVARKAVDIGKHPRVVDTTYLRIRANLSDGLAMIQVDPLILEGHLYAAARLLQGVAARIEGEGDDAESA